jgi:hypothetical protein
MKRIHSEHPFPALHATLSQRERGNSVCILENAHHFFPRIFCI